MELSAYFDDPTRRDWQEATEGTVRFAMVGLGWWTRDRAIPAVEEADLCETTVLVSGSTEKADAVASELETVEACLTYGEFKQGEGVEAYDAVYICTPNALHLDHVRAAASHGKDILCEKPMEATVDRARDMVEEARVGDVKLMVAYRMQTEPAVRRMRELVRDGFIGEPVHVHGHMSQRLLEMIPDPDQWRLDPEFAGPGASVTDLGIYPINTARFVIDEDPVAVSATMTSDSGGFEAVPDERAGYVLEFSNGGIGTMSASQNAYRSGRLSIIGRKGELVLEPAYFNDDRARISLSREGTTAEVSLPTVDQMEEEFEYFSDRILTERPVAPDGDHGVRDMRTIEAVFEAARTGRQVSI